MTKIVGFHNPKRNREVERLGDEIFGMIESTQGRAFVSDGVRDIASRDEFFSVIRNHYNHAKLMPKIFERFLKAHGEMPKQRRFVSR